ncbi:FadR/GntR family transcriptional regulator [Microbacterium sp. AGC85]
MSLSSSINAATSTRVERLSAGEAVFLRLREEIEAKIFPVGNRLPSEARLAERYGVSRPVVREALRSCATLGLTETRSGSGTVVISAVPSSGLRLGRYSADDLFEARPHIEGPAAGLAAQRRTNDDVTNLETLLQRMAEEDDPRKWVQLDAELHIAIAAYTGNRVFAAVVTEIREAIAAESELLAVVTHRQTDSHLEHERIVDAIARGDAQDASAAMHTHLGAVASAVAIVMHPRRSAPPV